MATTVHWILSSTYKWHAWRAGNHATVCGRIDADALRKIPARKISAALPKDQNSCAECVRKTGAISVSVDTPTGAWILLLRMHLKHTHARVSEPLLKQLAQRLAEIGFPSSAEGQDVFGQVRFLLLTPLRIERRDSIGRVKSIATFPHLKAALDKLPPNSKALQQVATAMQSWRAQTNNQVISTRFRPDRVIETILQIPAPEPYIAHLKSRGLYQLAAIFHPNTLARARKDTALRGLFGSNDDSWDATISQLNIVTD